MDIVRWIQPIRGLRLEHKYGFAVFASKPMYSPTRVLLNTNGLPYNVCKMRIIIIPRTQILLQKILEISNSDTVTNKLAYQPTPVSVSALVSAIRPVHPSWE